MIAALDRFTDAAFHIVFALIATGFVIMLAGCVGVMIYALYKGATDRTWR
jgi:hypothetical protein